MFSFIAFRSDEAVKEIDSASSVAEQVLVDNQQRCEFFKEFSYDPADRLGAVSALSERELDSHFEIAEGPNLIRLFRPGRGQGPFWPEE